MLKLCIYVRERTTYLTELHFFINTVHRSGILFQDSLTEYNCNEQILVLKVHTSSLVLLLVSVSPPVAKM